MNLSSLPYIQRKQGTLLVGMVLLIVLIASSGFLIRKLSYALEEAYYIDSRIDINTSFSNNGNGL